MVFQNFLILQTGHYDSNDTRLQSRAENLAKNSMTHLISNICKSFSTILIQC